MRTSLVVTALSLLAATGVQAQTWTVDTGHSSAQFAVSHMMVSTVRGDMGKVTGTVTYDGKNLAAATVQATIDVTGINTRDERRDAHLKSPDFFDAAKFPTITFLSKKVIPAADGSFKLVGDLTMHGVTREVTLQAEALKPTVQMGAAVRTGVSATTKLNRQDFGLSWSRVMDNGGLMVGNEVSVTIDLELVQQPAK